MNLKFGKEDWDGDINLGILSIKLVFKAIRLDEITKEWVQIREWRANLWNSPILGDEEEDIAKKIKNE